MPSRTPVPSLVCIAALLTGCRSADSVRRLPLDLGARARYALPAEEVLAALPAAMDEVGVGPPEITVVDSAAEEGTAPEDDATVEDDSTASAPSATILLGSTGMRLLSYGELTRVAVRGEDESHDTDVRALSRARYLLDWSGRADRRPPRLLGDLDRRLGPESIVPYDGMRLRGVMEGSRIVGIARRADDGSWSLARRSDEPLVRLQELTEIEVSRGSYTRRADWALGLGLIGWVVGLALPPGDCGLGVFEVGCKVAGRMSQANLGLVIGILGGAVIGSLHRTEVWSGMTSPSAAPSRALHN